MPFLFRSNSLTQLSRDWRDELSVYDEHLVVSFIEDIVAPLTSSFGPDLGLAGSDDCEVGIVTSFQLDETIGEVFDEPGI